MRIVGKNETERRTYDYHHMLTGAFHAKEVRIFDLGKLFRRRHRDLREMLRRERLRLAKSRSVFDLIAQAATILTLFGMLVFIAARTIQGAMTLGDMVMYYQAFQRAQGYLQEIMGGLAGLYEDSMFLNHFYDFLDLKPKTFPPEHCVAVPRPMQTGIALEHVSFRYPTTGGEVLHDTVFHSLLPCHYAALLVLFHQEGRSPVP